MMARVYRRFPNFNKNISPKKGKKTSDFGAEVVKSVQKPVDKIQSHTFILKKTCIFVIERQLYFLKHAEYQLQKAVCKYLDLQYPEVMYLSDSVAQVKLTMPQAARNKAIQKQGFKCPDLLILEPRNGWHGLFIELKTKSPFKKDGNIYENEHLKGQAMTIGKLTEKGYLAIFAWSFEQAKEIIDGYMKQARKG